ncbi:MAG: hypothetical protein ACN4GR_16190 [Arenicellales bacterium]
MKKKKILFILISVFAIQSCFAAEIDSVTPRNVALGNSIDTINEIMNQRIEEGIRKANAQQDYVEDTEYMADRRIYTFCDEKTLYTELRKAIFQSFTVAWGLKGYDLEKQLRGLLVRQSYSLSLNDSIYRDIDYIEGLALNLKELSDVVNINGYLVGLDKIGHFFAQGWQYFELTDYDKETLYKAIAWGRKKEAGLFGYTTTGIFSFADLVANLNGWRFWNKVLLKQDDPLKGVIANYFDRPYVSCDIQIIDSIRNRRIIRAWEYNTRFDLADYIDGAWDEGNNCNSYADPMIEEKVTARINYVAPDFVCPLIAKHCTDALDKYGYYAKYVLHPSCLTN